MSVASDKANSSQMLPNSTGMFPQPLFRQYQYLTQMYQKRIFFPRPLKRETRKLRFRNTCIIVSVYGHFLLPSTSTTAGVSLMHDANDASRYLSRRVMVMMMHTPSVYSYLGCFFMGNYNAQEVPLFVHVCVHCSHRCRTTSGSEIISGKIEKLAWVFI